VIYTCGLFANAMPVLQKLIILKGKSNPSYMKYSLYWNLVLQNLKGMDCISEKANLKI